MASEKEIGVEIEMKITVARREFAEALKVVTKAVAVKSQTPILSGIYLSAFGSCLEMQGTDNSVGIIAKIPANVEESGEAVILGKKLFEVIQKVAGETVTITTDDKDAEISSAGSKFKLLVYKSADFPKIEVEESTNTFTLRKFSLKKMIKQTAFAADKRPDARPMYTGVMFRLKGEEITLAATNTHRIAVVYGKLRVPAENELEFIVPAKILQENSAVLDDTGEVKISCTGKTANFTFDNLFVTARLIAGSFPPFEGILNEEKTIAVSVVREEILKALERVSVIGKETDYQTVSLLFDKNIKVSSSSPDVGNAEEYVVATITGGELDISFNYNYLTEALKVMDADKIQIGLSGNLKPIKITPVGDDSFHYVVTPVRRS